MSSERNLKMAVARKKLLTPQEYLAMEEQSEIRHEFVNGEIYAMAGATANHNQITGNVYMELRQRLRSKPCRVFIADMRLRIKEPNVYVYPDVMIICGKVEFEAGRRDVAINPIVIIEVLSDATEKYDRTKKFAYYRQIRSLQEYVMIDQSRVYVECFRRSQSHFWVLETYEALNTTLHLQSVEVEIPLQAIYEQVELEEGA